MVSLEGILARGVLVVQEGSWRLEESIVIISLGVRRRGVAWRASHAPVLRAYVLMIWLKVCLVLLSVREGDGYNLRPY